MKFLTLVGLWIALQPERQQAERLLTGERAGKIALGMTVDAVYAAYGRENVALVDLYGEGHFTPAIQIFLPSERGTPVAVATIAAVCGRYVVMGVSVSSAYFRTGDGLGVGSTLREVRQRYPGARINREEQPSLIVSDARLTFATSDDRFTDSTRVVRVWTTSVLPDSARRCPR